MDLVGRSLASPTSSTCGSPKVSLRAGGGPPNFYLDASSQSPGRMHPWGGTHAGVGSAATGVAAAAEAAVREHAELDALCATLASNPVLAPLASHHLRMLLAVGERRRVPRYSTIVRLGAVDTPLWVVLRGSVVCHAPPAPPAAGTRAAEEAGAAKAVEQVQGVGALFGEAALSGEPAREEVTSPWPSPFSPPRGLSP